MVGCSGGGPAASETGSGAAPASTPAAAPAAKVEKMTTDVVVIGAGGSGSAAATQAAELGAKVILLEKLAKPGGTTAMGGGLFGADSKLMKANGEKPVDTDALFAAWEKEMVWKADANLVRKYLALSSKTVDWLLERGYELHKVAAVQLGHEFHGYHKYNELPPTKYFERLLAGFQKNGGQLLLETPAKKLIVDEKGAVTGVIAEKKDGTQLEITAKSVVIATGGYVGDTKWVSEAFDGVTVAPAGLLSNVGDGIKMAWEAGAAHRGENVHLAHVTKVPGDLSKFDPAQSMLASSSIAYLAINPWVNSQGVRFANEDIIQDRALTSNAAIMQGNFYYTIFSKNMLDTLEAKGAAALGLQEKVAMGPIEELTPMKKGWTGLNAMIEELINQKVAFKGNTYEELAKAAGMDPDKFVFYMNKYNADAKAGKDTLMGKRAAHMVPLGDGPYYAIKVVPTNLCTLGGIRINEDLQVVKDDPNSYAPIPNLYACGSDVGGLYSDHYVLLEGGSQGWAYNSGRMAGASAASNALGKKIVLPGLEAFMN
jgi:fumarate reductase flavoprotein subunit